jgi:replicative DNA helicase
MSDAAPAPASLAPHSQEAEECVIGSVLIDPSQFSAIAHFLKAGDFYILRNAWIWEAMERLYERNELIEYVTVVSELRAMGRLDQVGGVGYLSYTVSQSATAMYGETYGQIVRRTALRRHLLEAANTIALLARDETTDVTRVIQQAESTLFSVTEGQGRQETVNISLVANELIAYLGHLIDHPDSIVGMPTGFYDLDAMLGGVQKNDLLILAARPGMGKTSFMLNLTVNSARVGTKVAYFSLEMSNSQLLQRMISSETGFNTHSLRTGQIRDSEWELIKQSANTLGELPIYLDDTPALTVSQLRSKCRRLKKDYGLDMIVVDYLQLMSGDTRNDNRVQEISYISRGLKEIARELNVGLIAGSQLSRAVEQRADKRPVLSDLRESGSIEQDADIVMFIYRDDVYTGDESERPNEADILISKHRNGPTGHVTLLFNKNLTKFQNMNKTRVNLDDL